MINGQKIWTSGAHHADWMFILVRTDPDAPKHEGISFMLLPMDQEGVTVKPIRLISGESPFNETFFDDAIANRGMPSNYWVINIQAGFEIWNGGTGLTCNYFWANVN